MIASLSGDGSLPPDTLEQLTPELLTRMEPSLVTAAIATCKTHVGYIPSFIWRAALPENTALNYTYIHLHQLHMASIQCCATISSIRPILLNPQLRIPRPTLNNPRPLILLENNPLRVHSATPSPSSSWRATTIPAQYPTRQPPLSPSLYGGEAPPAISELSMETTHCASRILKLIVIIIVMAN